MLLGVLSSLFSSNKILMICGGFVALAFLPQLIVWYSRNRSCDAFNLIRPGTELDFALFLVYTFNKTTMFPAIWEMKKAPYVKSRPLASPRLFVPIDENVRMNKTDVFLKMTVKESNCVETNERPCYSSQATAKLIHWGMPPSRQLGNLLKGETPKPSPEPYPYRYQTVRFDMVYEDGPVNWELAQHDPALVRYRFARPKHMFVPVLEADKFFDIYDQRRRINLTASNFSVGLEVNIRGSFAWKTKHLVDFAIDQQYKELSMKREIDKMKRIFLNTSASLLWFTFIVTVLNSIFHVLAFEKDLQFWSQKKNFTGISLGTVALQFLGELILFLNILDYGSDVPLLIKLQSIGSLFLGASKIWTLAKFSKKFPFLKVRKEYRAKEANEADAAGMRILYWALTPLLIGYFIYELVYGKFTGIRSYIIHCASGAVYSFGFLGMLPQLYVNYKLKTVAGMSRAALVYKVITTFIDDLYSYISELPLMYKIACLRDDVVFVVWVVQCFLYPVDPTRANEFGLVEKTHEDTETDEPKDEPKDEKQKTD